MAHSRRAASSSDPRPLSALIRCPTSAATSPWPANRSSVADSAVVRRPPTALTWSASAVVKAGSPPSSRRAASVPASRSSPLGVRPGPSPTSLSVASAAAARQAFRHASASWCGTGKPGRAGDVARNSRSSASLPPSVRGSTGGNSGRGFQCRTAWARSPLRMMSPPPTVTLTSPLTRENGRALRGSGTTTAFGNRTPSRVTTATTASPRSMYTAEGKTAINRPLRGGPSTHSPIAVLTTPGTTTAGRSSETSRNAQLLYAVMPDTDHAAGRPSDTPSDDPGR